MIAYKRNAFCGKTKKKSEREKKGDNMRNI